ncbi:MAG: HD domain-containing protein [Promethearchaeota archaeon]
MRKSLKKKTLADVNEKIKELKAKSKIDFSKPLPTKDEAIEIMKFLGLSRNIINHELAVMRKARNLAHNITKVKVDIELVKIGALMHDIGRCVVHSMEHGPVGGDIIRKLGFQSSEKLARVVERHILAGLTPEEALKFGLPERNYIPETIEEKLVCFSDKLHSGSRKVTIEKRFQRWIEKYSLNDFLKSQINRAKNLEEEILGQIF